MNNTANDTARYQFFTHWRVRATTDEISDVLSDASKLPEWWPSVYLEVNRLKEGDENHIGEVIDLYTKGFLPYTLRWRFTVTESIPGKRIKLESEGDFVGYGIWTFEQDGDHVNMTYEWNIVAEKPLLRDLSWMLKPIFSANHRWAMDMGLRSLELELVRRRALTPEERAAVPPPPPPTPTSPVPYVIGALLVLFIVRRTLRSLFKSR